MAKTVMRGISKSSRDKAFADERRILREAKKLGRQKTTDTFQNFGLNIGIGTDNALSQSTYGFNPITRIRTLLEWIHRGSWVGGIAIDLVADDMTRAGIEIKTKLDPQAIEKIINRATQLGIWNGFNETNKWGRLYGGAIGFFMIDGQDPSTPLRIESVGKGQFRGIFPLDRWQLEPQISQGQLVNEMGPNFGLPMYYRTTNAPGLPNLNIHYTRCFRMIGIKLPYQQRIMEMLWGLSVLERINDRMIAFDSTTMGAAQLAYKLHYRVIKIKDLRQILAAGGKAAQGLTALVDVMRRFQGIEGLTIIDSEDEFEPNSAAAASVAGFAELLIHFGQQLSGALQIPLVRMFGQSPSGLNSSGESDLRMYYDNVKQDQEKTMRIPVHVVYRLLSQDVGTPLGNDFDFDFKSLWQMSDQQQADVAARDTESVLAARERGLISDQLALQELRQRGRFSNRWQNITDEIINKAEEEPAPPPELGIDSGEGGGAKSIKTTMPAIKKPSKPKGDSASHFDFDNLELPPAVALAIDWPDIDWDHEVAEIAVSSMAGGRTYVDRRMPRVLNEPGLIGLNPSVPLNLHEQIERWLMVAFGLTYDQAHIIATREEKRWFAESGFDWEAWQWFIKGMLNLITASSITKPPPDPHVQEGIGEKTIDTSHLSHLPMRDYGGIPIIIEHHKGERRGHGFPILTADYGYIQRTSSAEGQDEKMDCFVGDVEGLDYCYVTDQHDAVGAFDEHKIMFGFNEKRYADACWDSCYNGNGASIERKATTRCSIADLKSWLANGDVMQPFAEQQK